MAKAIRFHTTGGPEVLRLEHAEAGAPGPGQARVRHSFIAVNFIDIYFRTGRYPLALPNGLGSDAVGVVEAVGEGVTEVRPGDRVGYLMGPQGAYSDVRVMPAEVLIPLPDGISDRTAATLMMKGMTAQYLFRQVHPLQGGETILYHAAAGGATSWHAYARFVLERAADEGVALKVHGNQVAAIPSSAYPTPAKRPNNSRLDTQKLQKAFALNLPEWQVGVARMLTEVLEK